MTHRLAALLDAAFSRFIGTDRYSQLFNESQHPRGTGGRFTLKGTGVSKKTTSQPAIPKAVKAVKRAWDPRPAGTYTAGVDDAIKKQYDSLSGQKDLFAQFDEEFAKHITIPEPKPRQKDLFSRLGLRDRYSERWITIGAKDGHKGTHVKIDEQGAITKGPSSLKGENLHQLPSGRIEPSESTWGLKRDPAVRNGGRRSPPETQNSLFDKKAPKQEANPGYGPKTTADGRKVGPGLLKVGDMHVDPQKFQYKMNTDNPAGVTNQFSDVEYNPELAGTIHVWHDPQEDKTYVVNGHHRHELAKRSGFNGHVQVQYLDAKNALEARAKGAIINIAGGNGTAIDAAKFMRDTGATLDMLHRHGVSVKGAIARDANDLKDLSDGLFSKVTQGIYPTGRALSIARHVKNHDDQNALARRIEKWEDEKGRNVSDSTVEEMAAAAAAAPRVKNDDGPKLFKDAAPEDRPVDVERGDLVASVKRELAGKLNAFKAVSTNKKADILAEHNKIDASSNKTQADQLERLLHDFNREVHYKGDLSDLVNKAALEYANEPKRRKQILDSLRDNILEMLKTVPQNESGRTGEADQIGDDGVQRYKPAPGQKGFFSRSRSRQILRDIYSKFRSEYQKI